MWLVANGQDGNGLILEIFGKIFSSFASAVMTRIKSVETGFDYFFFQSSFDFASLVV